ncbi:hypothetical protein GW17_00033516 [Ensete ventricosum]|nr:hypothetical protein GW17_00033516 [Ensete ventricosum]
MEATKLGVTLFGGRSPKTRCTEKTLLPYSHEHLSVRSVQWGKFPVRGSLVPSWSVIAGWLQIVWPRGETLPLGWGLELVVELELGNRECVELTMPLVVLIGLTAEGMGLQTRKLPLEIGLAESGCGEFGLVESGCFGFQQVVNHSATYRPW